MLRIRDAQMQALRRHRSDDVVPYVGRALQRMMPERAAALSEPALASIVREASETAARLDVREDGVVVRLAALVLVFGAHFEMRESWAAGRTMNELWRAAMERPEMRGVNDGDELWPTSF
jgi:hypothetical protein